MKTVEELIARQQALVDGAKAAERELNEQEAREFADLQKEIDRLRAAEKAVAAERARVSEITAMCRDFGIDAAEFIADGAMTVEGARAALLDKLKEKQGPARLRMKMGETDSERFRAAAADALAMRCGTEVEKAADGAHELRGMGLKDLAAECLVRAGALSDAEVRRMSADDMFVEICRAQSFYGVSDFPAILDTAIKKNIVHLYNNVPTTFQEWCTKGSVSDFKATPEHNYIIGGGEFKKVEEGAVLTQSKPETSLLPTRKVDSYGTQFTMSRQAFVNDDLGFLAEVPGVYAAAAKRAINKQVYELLFNNSATVYDNKVLFCADHKNDITTGAAPSLTEINKMMLKMQAQTDPFGEAINIIPRMLVLPVGYGMQVDTILHAASITTDDNAAGTHYNPMKGRGLKYVEDAALNALAGDTNAVPWFMVADPLSAKSVQVDYLNGREVPNIRRMEVAGQLGFVWDIYLDWGITVIDWRGIVRNPGVAISL